MKRIGDNLKYLLEINRMSGSELARKIDVSQASISRIISTNRIPKINGIVETLSLYFKVDEKWLTEGNIVQHGCKFEFNDPSEPCPDCNKKLSFYIKPLLRLSEAKIGVVLYSKIITINQWIRTIRNIEIGINNAQLTLFTDKDGALCESSIATINLLDLEKLMLLKERAQEKLSTLKTEFENECDEGLKLEDYLKESNWDEDDDTYGYEGSLREASDIRKKIKS